MLANPPSDRLTCQLNALQRKVLGPSESNLACFRRRFVKGREILGAWPAGRAPRLLEANQELGEGLRNWRSFLVPGWWIALLGESYP